MNCYFIFANEKRAELKMNFPLLKGNEISKELAKSFKNLSKEEKARYEGKAKRLLEEYIKEKAFYEERYGKMSIKRTDLPGTQERKRRK